MRRYLEDSAADSNGKRIKAEKAYDHLSPSVH